MLVWHESHLSASGPSVLEEYQRTDPLAILDKFLRTDAVVVINSKLGEVHTVRESSLNLVQKMRRDYSEAVKRFFQAIKSARTYGFDGEYRRARQALCRALAAFGISIPHQLPNYFAVLIQQSTPSKREGRAFFHVLKVDGRNLP